MAKKRAGQQRLDGMEVEIPEEVQDKVDEYMKKLRIRMKARPRQSWSAIVIDDPKNDPEAVEIIERAKRKD